MKKIKKALSWIFFLIGGRGKIAKESVEDSICDFSGQGRNKEGV